MATILDWPTSAAFRCDTPMRIGLSTSKSGATGFYTGNRETLSHTAERLTLQMPLPPCSAAQAAEREGYLMAAISAGYWFRLPMPHRPYPVGAISGTLTAKTSASTGARSITLAGATGTNLLLGSSFEFDSNSDGLADGWTQFTAGTTGAITFTRNGTSPVHGSWRQSCAAAGLGTTGSDSFGIFRDVSVRSSTAYTFSGYVTITVGPGATHTVTVQWRDSGGAFISADQATLSGAGGAFQRLSVSATSPANAASARLIITLSQRSGSAGASAFVVDATQLQVGPLTDYAPAATLAGGDFLATGGNLLMVGSAATGNDAGDITVPLALPLQKAVSAGAAVTWSGPVGVWELDMDSIDLTYLGTWLQDGVVLQFRQRIV